MTARRPMATPEEVAAYLQIEVKTLYQWRWKGIGPKSSKIGRGLRYRWAEVDAWVEAQERAAAA